MGQDSRNRTEFIFNSLLTLGVLEDSKRPLTKDEILTKLLDIYEERFQVKRYIDHIKLWLKRDNEDLVQINKRKRENVYKINFEGVYKDEYIDFLEVLLTLNEIRKKEPDSAMKNLYKKDGDRPLGIVTNLILAIKQRGKLSITYEGLDQIIKFKPSRITRSPEKWLVEGEILNSEEIHPPLEISMILKLE